MIGDKLASKELFESEECAAKYIEEKPWELIAALICSITDNAIKSELSNLKNKENLSANKSEKLIEDYLFAEREPLRDEILELIEGEKPTIS